MDVMMQRMHLDSFVGYINKGDYNYVITKVNTLNMKLENSLAVNYIAACCNSLLKIEQVNETDLKILLRLLFKFVDDFTPDLLKKFLLSVYHITVYFLKMEDFESVVELKSLILLECCTKKFDESFGEIYDAIIARISNSVAKTKNGVILKNFQCLILRRLEIFSQVSNPVLAFNQNFISQMSSEEILKNYVDVVHHQSNYDFIASQFIDAFFHFLEFGDYKLAELICKETQEVCKDWLQIQVVMWMIPNYSDFPQIIPKNITINCKLKPQYQVILGICEKINSKKLKWAENFEEESLVNFFKFLYRVHKEILKSNENCLVCSTLAVKVLQTIYLMSYNFLKIKTDYSKTHRELLLNAFNHHLKLAAENWFDCGYCIHNIAVVFLHKNDDFGANVMQIFIKLCLIPGKDNTEQSKHLQRALLVLGQHYLKTGNWENALSAFALGLNFFKESQQLGVKWVETKFSNRELPNIQELTVVQVLERNNLDLYNVSLGVDKKIELLTLELRYYKDRWASKVPMMSVIRELSEIAPSLITAKVFVEIWGECTLRAHENVPKILHNILEKVKSNYLTNVMKTYVAHLYFMQHQYQAKESTLKLCTEMDQNLNSTTKADFEAIPKDPNDECDITSSYASLQISNYLKIVKNLNKSLEIFHGVDLNDPELDKERCFRLLLNVGHEFHLHNHIVKTLEAWEISLKISELLTNQMYFLEVFCFITEVTDIRKDFCKNLLLRAEAILMDHSSEITDEMKLLFYISKAEAHLFKDFNVAYEALKKALELGDGLRVESYILRARLHYLHHKFVMLPCWYKIVRHKDQSLVNIHLAYQAASKYVRRASNGGDPYEMRIFFDIAEGIGKHYYDLTLPRDLRAYLREPLLLAQKLVLPLRSSVFLYYLAQADLICCKIEDARVKITDMAALLGIWKGTVLTKPTKPVNRKRDIVVDNLVYDLKEMTLQLPAPPRSPRRSCSGSPTLQKSSFKIPGFTSHSRDCSCFYCICLEYKVAVLRCNYLSGLLDWHDCNENGARNFFYGTLSIYEFFENREEFCKKQICQRLSSDLVPDVKEVILEVFYLILYQYTVMSLWNSDLVNAEKFNRRLRVELQNGNVLKYKNLHNAAIMHQQSIAAIVEEQKTKSNWKPKMVEVEINSEDSRTPESKRSVVSLSAEVSPAVFSIARPKKIHFNFDDVEMVENENNSGLLTVPSFFTLPKTPHPTISIKKDSKSAKKTVLTSIPATPDRENARNRLDGESARTQRAKRTLDKKTKLLTQQLKSSAVKSALVYDENEETGKKKELKTVKKNLLSELEVVAKDDDDGLRRSRRNKTQR